jgi:light-regulated signal transduction histidine kinase (bacteriophytochrome)
LNTSFAVTLDNCADEPIHIPGSIQPHGALLAFNNAAELICWSANAPAVLGVELVLSLRVTEIALAPELKEAVVSCIDEMENGEVPARLLEASIGNEAFDCIVHACNGTVIVEYERRTISMDTIAAFALKAHSAIERLKRQKSIDSLLQLAVDQIRNLSGFDRVMAYHFRPDESGDVVAESRIDELEPYLGRRYPASDIPAQARRLYVVSTLRLITDVHYQAVPIVGRAGATPLDMSHCVLRSVSPIHIEYLQNMGVGASMSVSIVINDRLWGLIACHHMSARQVPYSIRMAIDVMAQVLASTVQSLETRQRSALVEQAAQLRTRLIESLIHQDDVIKALSSHAGELMQSFDGEALILTHYGRLFVQGELPAGLAEKIVASLTADGSDLIERHKDIEWPEELRHLAGKWVGMLAFRFDSRANGWLVILRPEQIELVRWGGKPDKEIKHGPLGPRLTPRGSFDEWRETVRGCAEPWDTSRLLVARQLLAEMTRATSARHGETERAKEHLMAMLGHDLRNPLQTISMAAELMELGGSRAVAGQRIRASSGRMQRLISQVLDMSLINSGMSLKANSQDTDLVPLLKDMVDEFRTAHPQAKIDAALPVSCHVEGDPDRLAQVVSNLISNAYHHGTPGQAIDVTLASTPSEAVIEVRNAGIEIEKEAEVRLFNPYKENSTLNDRNRGGLGLGLHIVQQIVLAHAGSIEYRYDAPYVFFRVTLPAAPATPTIAG